ncbi:hypothetical protein [Aeromonas veronii]|uniref:hypothetical protein n=1 Tax=Aeromonas veronii TaxID=654 RepID=UPI003B9F0457
MIRILYSRTYEEFKVQVMEATYYTSDKQDAYNTCADMANRAGQDMPQGEFHKRATAAQEDNW